TRQPRQWEFLCPLLDNPAASIVDSPPEGVGGPPSIPESAYIRLLRGRDDGRGMGHSPQHQRHSLGSTAKPNTIIHHQYLDAPLLCSVVCTRRWSRELFGYRHLQFKGMAEGSKGE